MLRLLSIALICEALLAQQGQTPPVQQTGDDDPNRIVVGVDVVSVPVWVMDASGHYLNGLREDQFKVFDNDKPQTVDSVDLFYHPISMVVVIQANADATAMLPSISRIGNLMKPLVLGEQGEAAVMTYDSHVKTLQNFTNDGDQITAAVKKINSFSGVSAQHMFDAIDMARDMLSNRPKDRRRVILLIGERRDLGSQIRGRETLINLQNSNIEFYSINMSQLLAKLTKPAPDPRPDVIPPAAVPMPSGVAATPTTVMQTYGTEGGSAQFMPLLIEIYRDAKAIFKTNPVTAFAKGTGGEEFSFTGQRSLEQAISDLSDKLHTSYQINYRPNDKEDGGFHRITVDVTAAGAKYIYNRPGYYLGPKR